MIELLSKHGGQLAMLAIVFGSVGLLVFVHMRKGNPFVFYDMMLDPVTRKASVDSCITLFFAILSAWYIVYKTMHPTAGDVGALLIQVLSVFLLFRGAHQGIQAYAAKPPPPPAAPDQIRQQVNVIPDAPTLVAPTETLPSAVTTSRVTK